MKISNMILLSFSLISTYGFAQPEPFLTLQTPHDVLMERAKRIGFIEGIKPFVFEHIQDIADTQQKIIDLNNKYRIAQQQKRTTEAQKARQQLIAQEKNLKLELEKFKEFMSHVTMNITDDLGNTPLHKAVEIGNLKLVEWIFQFQPGLVKRKNSAGKTPIELAAGRPEILKLFIGLKQ